MAAIARGRIVEHGWTNASLVEDGIEDSALGGPCDAIRFNFTHDVLQSPAALGRVVAVSASRRPRCGGRIQTRVTTFEGLRRGWRHLAAYVPDLTLRTAMGSGLHRARPLRAGGNAHRYRVNAISLMTAPGSRLLLTLRERYVSL